MPATPTVVLVHGAFADASGFAGMIRVLQSRGIEARAPIAEPELVAQVILGALEIQ